MKECVGNKKTPPVIWEGSLERLLLFLGTIRNKKCLQKGASQGGSAYEGECSQLECEFCASLELNHLLSRDGDSLTGCGVDTLASATL